ncbi:organic cation transporter protein-like [Pectinophora gossypiella]|uniref:organic cation transporter protein-like n=1 Tax=Pectinophora gossypiella TaxID=13191 RepID=UPI00214F5960|nr:organic cation transporter protein-like [Pectinophora gossypiella]XP_049870129.1 organic cation transporter protein-like [Pectinophora gossypiella]XP_049870130.1 organic cation transporter protein-like [Pectinophora gossypiella]
METQDEDSLEEMMRKIGDFGPYQRFQFLLHITSAVTAGILLLSLVTVAAVPEHRCAIEGVDTPNHTEPWNSSLLIDAIPMNDNGKFDSCLMYGYNNTTVECHSWVYDTEYYKSSRGIEWNFVCSRRWMFAVAQTSTKSGAVVGSLVLGRLSDKYGRRTIFLCSAVLQLVFGTMVAFAPEFYSFIFIRFLCGFVGISPFKAGFVLTIELIGPRKRTVCGSLFEVGYAVGIMLLGAWGYLIENRFYLQLIYALHAVMLLPHWFLMDESPRWLWSQGRIKEAVAIIEKALKMNKSTETVTTPLVARTKSKKYTEEVGTLDLFRTPNLLKRTLIICFCWFANSVVYFGLTLNAGKLNGNPYFMLFLIGLVEVPGYIVAMFFVHRIGHRTLVSCMMFMSGSCCLIAVALPIESYLIIVVTMLGKMIVSGTFSVVIKYSAELFPTVARSSGVGLATMCSSLSGALTPMIILLDKFDPNIPTVVFGFIAILSGSTVLLLPETFGRNLPQTLEDGEKFGIGDTCFASCKGRRKSRSFSE